MKKLLKTKKLVVTTETVRTLTDKQLENVAGGATVAAPSQGFNEYVNPRCQPLPTT